MLDDGEVVCTTAKVCDGASLLILTWHDPVRNICMSTLAIHCWVFVTLTVVRRAVWYSVTTLLQVNKVTVPERGSGVAGYENFHKTHQYSSDISHGRSCSACKSSTPDAR